MNKTELQLVFLNNVVILCAFKFKNKSYMQLWLTWKYDFTFYFYVSDMICALGESTGYYALKNIRSKMLTDSVGKQILEYVVFSDNLLAVRSKGWIISQDKCISSFSSLSTYQDIFFLCFKIQSQQCMKNFKWSWSNPTICFL